MTSIADRPVGGFLDDLSSHAATPGGGAVAAVAAATGAALIAMVARLTQGRPGFEAVGDRMTELITEGDGARAELLALADRDIAAFDAVITAFAMPKETAGEKAARSAGIQIAFADAAVVPLEVARRSVALLKAAREVVATGNPDAASDGLSAAAMLHAAVLCALANVRINAKSLKDAAAAQRLHEEAGALESDARTALEATQRAFDERIGG